MKIEKFEDIIAWQKGQDLAVEIYKNFGGLKDFSFRDQICRASVSISNNIAEGFERGYDKEFARFLFIAKASCAEVKSMLYLAVRLNFLQREKAVLLMSNCDEISKIIRDLIKSINPK